MIRVKVVAQNFVKALSTSAFATPQAQSQALAAFADREIRLADDRNAAIFGRRVPKKVSVDGNPSANLSSVKPNGTIYAEWELGTEIVEWVYQALRKQAPVLTGEYRDSITIFADELAVQSAADAAGAQQVLIMATVPYARKLEGENNPARAFKAVKANRGKAAKYMSSQAPDGIFKAVEAIAKTRFGNQAKIYYTFRNLRGLQMMYSIEKWASKKAAKNAGRGANKVKRQYDRDVRNPALLIIFR